MVQLVFDSQLITNLYQFVETEAIMSRQQRATNRPVEFYFKFFCTYLSFFVQDNRFIFNLDSVGNVQLNVTISYHGTWILN